MYKERCEELEKELERLRVELKVRTTAEHNALGDIVEAEKKRRELEEKLRMCSEPALSAQDKKDLEDLRGLRDILSRLLVGAGPDPARVQIPAAGAPAPSEISVSAEQPSITVKVESHPLETKTTKRRGQRADRVPAPLRTPRPFTAIDAAIRPRQ